MKWSMRRASIGRAVATGLLASACNGSVATLPPYGEALVSVDTDMPSSDLVGRLRVDLYTEDGVWFESRDIGRSDPRDWPASFSVYSDDTTRVRRVLVRLRSYPEGVTRRYEGERYAPRNAYAAPHVADSLAELCANAPTLPIGGRVTMRRGGRALTDTQPKGNCGATNAGGSIAANVTITERGIYRFAIANADPYESEATLFLRSKCDDWHTQMECRSEPTASPTSSGHFARFDMELDPGTYTLMTGSELADWPADLTLEAIRVDGPITPLPALADPSDGTSSKATSSRAPRLMHNGLDETPLTEPLPTAAIDRLVVATLTPGERTSLHVTLHRACAGTMAKLGEDSARPRIENAETCIDTENVRVPAEAAPADGAVSSATPTSGAVECEKPAPGDDPNVICHPPGTFLFGSRTIEQFTGTAQQAAPERVASVSRFYLDRTEVSVGRFRAAVVRGLQLPSGSLFVNDGLFATPGLTEQQVKSYCTFTSAPGPHEDLPVTCISWSLARAFCQSEGGDLPTEVQWEYAAASAGRPHKTQFPWGNEPPSCEQMEWGRGMSTSGSAALQPCPQKPGVGVVSVDSHSGADGTAGDITPLGVVGLGGNAGEFVLDAARAYTTECWTAAAFSDPSCLDDNAPSRVVRGGSIFWNPTPATSRLMLPGAMGGTGRAYISPPLGNIGFRCAYPRRPQR
jgi:formylglycine-generating enzyme required for sulfatase activity